MALLAVTTATWAQQHKPREERGRHKHPNITEMISDLSSDQKQALKGITQESKARVKKLRSQQKAVRDSIATFMERDGDQSATLHPLFDREARLQSLISREMYATKVRVDEVLTPAQRQQVKEKCKKRERRK